MAFTQITPILFVALRYTLACPVLVMIMLVLKRNPSKTSVLMNNWKTIFVVGLTGPFLSQGLQYIGLSLTSAGETVLLLNMSPVFAVILALPLLGERITGRKVGGLLLATVGASLIVMDGVSLELGLELTRLFGDVIIIISTFLFAISGIAGKMAVKEVDSLSLTLFSTLISVPFLWITAFFLEDVTVLISVTIDIWFIALWVGIINSAFAFAIYYEVMKHIEASQVQITLNLISVWGVVMAILVLGEVLTILKVLGGAITIVGVILVQQRQESSMDHQQSSLEDTVS
jgi:drug/metabolite transporter (DMT)-like permease